MSVMPKCVAQDKALATMPFAKAQDGQTTQERTMRVAISLFAGVAAVTGLAFAAHAAAASINGRWTTKEKDAVIEISQCGATVCGRISKYLKTPPNGVDQKDVNNPDKSLRTRKLLGIAILYGLKADGEKWRGTIYDPRNGKSYRSVVYRQKNGNLSVEGCLGPICQKQVWAPAG
jgi:uncharacterized protein (DUF2147 family)